MIAEVFRYEWTRHRRGKFQVLLIGVVCLVLAGTVLFHWHQKATLDRAQQHWQKTSDELWANQPDRHPHRVAHYGHVVVRPLAPLSFIEPGVSPYVGNYLFLEAHRQNSSSVRSSALNPATLKLGFPSVATLMLTFWPLLLIVLGYGAFSQEWDSGRLFWLASLGAPVLRLFLGKSAIYLAYTGVVLLAVGLASMALLLVNGSFSLALLKDLLLVLLLFGLYSVFWVTITLWVSFYSRDSHQSLWRLLSVWIILAVVVPRLSTELAQAIYPTPDRANFEAGVEKAVHAVGNSHNPSDPYFSDFRQKVLARYGVERIEDLPVNWNGLVMAEGERITSEIFQTHYGQVIEQFYRQQRFTSWFGLLSPIISAKHILQGLTRSDRQSAQHFEETAEQFRFDLIQRLNHLHTHQIQRQNDRGQKVPARVWREMTLFDYQPPAQSRPNTMAIMSILLWCCLTVTAVLMFRGQEVRR